MEYQGVSTVKDRRYQWRFGPVVIASLLLALLRPGLARLIGDRPSFDLLFSLLIVTVLVLLLDQRRHRKTATALGVFALVFIWLGHVFDGRTGTVIFLLGTAIHLVFLGYALYRILNSIMQSRTTANALSGAVCGYLLLGIIWGDAYMAVEIIEPGSFHAVESFGDAIGNPKENPGVYEYFSFVTLTTLGYGDISPASETARNLAWIEAMTGQLYLAIFIAGLVGQHLAERRLEQSDS